MKSRQTPQTLADMPAITKLSIQFNVDESQTMHEAIEGLPGYVKEGFVEHAPGWWHGDFVVSCPEAPYLAEGDLIDDLAPHFPALLRLQKFHDASFQMQIAVGAPGPEDFELPSNMVAMLAALGASFLITTSNNPIVPDNQGSEPNKEAAG
jgi:hypothetical protein